MQNKIATAVSLIMLVTSTNLWANPVDNDNNAAKYVVYWTSWGTNQLDLNNLSPRLTALNLSFANVEPNTLKVVGSDGMLDHLSGRGWKEASYNRWTQYKVKNQKQKVLIAFGGETYSELWKTTLTKDNAIQIAKSMAQAVTQSYPVYEFDSQYIPRVVGYVTLDGIDLDVESAEGIKPEQANNVALLIQALRKEIPEKIITLTGFSTAADPVTCVSQPGPQCSFVGSKQSGELIPVLIRAGKDVDWVNNMAYDAGPDYRYDISQSNYAKYVAKSKVVLGLTIGGQWGPNGRFVESLIEIKRRAKWASAQSYGGSMIWAIGAQGGYPIAEQIKHINDIAKEVG